METAATQPFLSFAKVGERFERSPKTIGRWIETVAGFPQPVRVGCSRLFVREEIEAYIEKLKEDRDRNRRTK